MLPVENAYWRTEIITLRVGRNKQKFLIHRDALCRESRFFQACPAPNKFEEGKTELVTLDDIEAEVFDVILQFCYQRNIERKDLGVDDLIKAYMAADKLMMNNCKNSIMEAFRKEYSNNVIIMEIFHLALGSSILPDMQISKFITDQLAFDLYHQPAHYIDQDEDVWESDKFLEDFNCSRYLQEMLKKLVHIKLDSARGINIQDLSLLSGCHYHDHDEGEQCPYAVKDEKEDE